MEQPVLSLVNISKSFGGNRILRGLSIDIYKGEFITLLGESGCGKTTTLRCVAGLESIDSGDLLLNGVSVKDLPPDKRDVNTVFQNYALFPHMNVYDNIAYGPKLRGPKKDEIKRSVAEALELVKLPGTEKRMPSQLSGGQRQRVAIARALVNRPLILLLDEPLGALDMKLRKHMQSELKRIQAETGVTCVYVTHDQDEALNMSSRIAVMNAGSFEQVDTPREIYESPKSAFVAGFVGERNIFPAFVAGHESGYTIAELNGLKITARENRELTIGETASMAIHSDRAVLLTEDGLPGAGYENIFPCEVIAADYAGSLFHITALINNGISFKIAEYSGAAHKPWLKAGLKAFVGFSACDAVLMREPDRK